MWRDIRTGVLYGINAWAAYGVAEFAFLSVLTWALMAHWILTPLHWRLTAVLFASYAAAGTLAGAACGVVVWLACRYSRRIRALPAPTRFNAAASLSVVLVFGAGLLRERPISSEAWFGLAVCLLMVAMIALGVAFPRFRAWAGPWTVNLALVGVFWMGKNLPGHDSRNVRLPVAAMYFAVLMLLALWRPWKPSGRPMARASQAPARGALHYLLLPMVAIAGCSALGWSAGNQAAAAGAGGASPSRPNVILVTMDTVRADHLSLYGYARDTTPNLRRLAQEATLYTHALSTSDMTLSSHGSIFTGLYASQHGAHYSEPDYPFGRPLDRKFTTLAEILQANGYATMGAVANFAYAGRFVNMDQGFASFDDPAIIPVIDQRRAFYIRQTIRGILTNFVSTSAFDAECRRADEVTPSVLSSLDEARGAGKPFFLFVNYMDAHWPLIPPAPYDRLYPGRDKWFTTARYFDLLRDVLSRKREISAGERQHLISQYDGGIAYIDHGLGLVLERLKALGLYDNSLIIITSDHGESFGERQTLGHIMGVSQDEIHVPLLVKFPGERTPRVDAHYVSGVDLMPTVLDVAGLRTPRGLAGKSLRQLAPDENRFLIAESFPNPTYRQYDRARFARQERAYFAGNLKLVSATNGTRELYDLAADPGESHNLCQAESAQCGAMEAGLQQWLKSVAVQRGPSRAMGREALERLRSLGYVQ